MRPIVLTLVLLAAWPPVAAQTLSDVRKAVDDYFTGDGTRQPAREALRAWGNDALPLLRQLAGEPASNPLLVRLPVNLDDFRLVCAVDAIDTPEAIEFLIEILDGKTGVAPHQALDQLASATWKHGALLRNHVRFQQLVFKFALPSAGLFADLSRRDAARTIAALGWQDGVPLLELMLHDKNLRTREAAADALRELTGEDVAVERPPLGFPASDESELLVSAGTLGRSELQARFTTWFDGELALVTRADELLVSVDMAGARRAELDLSERFEVRDVLALPGADRWLLTVREPRTDRWSGQDLAVVVGATRNELWRHVPSERGLHGAAPLFDETRCSGVVLAEGGMSGLRGFDLDGRETFALPGLAAYGVASHPRLPGVWLHWHGEFMLRDNAGSLIGGPGSALGPPAYVTEALLFPDENGRPGVLVASMGFNSVPTIARYDEGRRLVWSATVPADVEGLALLDPDGGPMLAAATLTTGELLVFDMEGTLRQRVSMTADTRLPSSTHSSRVATYSISTGPMPGRRYGLVVGLLERTLLYELK